MTLTPDTTAPVVKTRPVDPEAVAAELWDSLKHYQPAIAGALALHLRALTDDWPMRQFGVGRTDAVLTLPPPLEPGHNLMPESAPYNETDIEDCDACSQAQLICRWHAGQAAAHQWWHDHVMAALRADPDARVEDVLTHQEAEAERVPCPCRRCLPPAPARRSWWRRPARFITRLLED